MMAANPEAIVSLEQAKTHLRISASRTAEDPYVLMLIAVAGRSVERRIDRVIFGDARDATLTEADNVVIGQVMLLLIGGWYWNRESVSAEAVKEVPLAVGWLLDPLHRWAL
jgi:hypothetical protein